MLPLMVSWQAFGEAFALCWDDVSLVDRTLRVERAVSAGHVQLTKTDDSRIVDLTARLVAVDAVVALTAAVSFQ